MPNLSNTAGVAFGLGGDQLFPERQVNGAQWGAFGDVLFQTTFAPKDFVDNRRWRITQNRLVQGYPSHQFSGEDERTVRMTIELHNDFVDITSTELQLTEMAKGGIPRGLVVGIEALGMFSIREMPRTITETLPNGTITAVSYNLTLVEVRA